jgi:hypothetical protein
MRNIYIFLSSIYTFISTLYENTLFRHSSKNEEFLENGFCKIKNLKHFELNNNETSLMDVNKYYKRIVLSKFELNKLISFIFIENNIIEKITNKTGFNYSIDFFTAYETSSIESEDKDQGWYANHPHRDLPFSKNMLKLIVPLQKITIKDGPLKIINKQKSQDYSVNNNIYFESVTCDISEAFLFHPNSCYHYASSPEPGRRRKQMMFQLNPSRKWEMNEKIYDLQNRIEPKFPFFAYLFHSKKNLDLT